MTTERKSLGHDAFWSFTATGTKAVSAAIIFVLLANRLEPASYGVYSALLAVFLLTGPFVVMGVMHPVTKRVSSDRSQAQAAWGAALLPGVGASLLVGAVAALLVPAFFDGVGWLAAFALALSEFLGWSLVMTSTFLLNSVNRYPSSAGLTTVWSLFRLASAVVTLVVLEPTVTGASVGFLVAALAAGSIAVVLAWRAVGPPKFNLGASRGIAKEGLPYSFASSGSSVLNDVDKLMLIQIKGDEPTGIYSGGNKILSLAAVPMFALLGATYPRFFAAGHESGVAGTAALARKLSPIVFAYSIAVGVGLYLAAPHLIPPILGPGYEESVTVVRWMIAMPLVNLCGLLAGEVLTGASYQGLRNRMILGAAAVNITFNAVLIPLYSWNGAVIATYCSEATLLASFLWWIKKHYHDPPRVDPELATESVSV
jgi:O-antigen/teichoic acid export membrane protein